MKKKEMELVKLKDRLHVLLIDKTDQKIGEQQLIALLVHRAIFLCLLHPFCSSRLV
jgi:hypothetical protein